MVVGGGGGGVAIGMVFRPKYFRPSRSGLGGILDRIAIDSMVFKARNKSEF